MRNGLILTMIILATPAYAGSVTLTTYYPSPSGNYDKLNVANGVNQDGSNLTVGTAASTNTVHGSVVIGEDAGATTTIKGGTSLDLGTVGSPVVFKGNPTFTKPVTFTNTAPATFNGTSNLVGASTIHNVNFLGETTTFNGTATTFNTPTTFTSNVVLGNNANDLIELKGNVSIGGNNGASLTIVDPTEVRAGGGEWYIGTGGADSGTVRIHKQGGVVVETGGINTNALTVPGQSTLGNTVVIGRMELNDGNGQAKLKVAKAGAGATTGYYAVYAP